MQGSVLVVGGGIAGMRAATELLGQGFRVHLLEKTAGIGGKMAEIDRLFPTNEHAACALRPLTTTLLENPNITILTSARLVSLQGVAGDFTARVVREGDPRNGGPRELDLTVGAVIVATGLEEEKGEPLERLGYGEIPNVLTALEFGRQLSGLGPTGGIIRLAGGEEPRRLAWIVRDDISPVAFLSASAQALAMRDANEE